MMRKNTSFSSGHALPTPVEFRRESFQALQTRGSGRSRPFASKRSQSAKGTKRIEDIEVGDLVWTCDHRTDTFVTRRVLHIFRTADQPVLEISVAVAERKELILATTEHPFWVEGSGWVAASKLRHGDRLRCHSKGFSAHVVGTSSALIKADVFNFEVETDHSYFVGNTGVLVHNSSSDPKKDGGPIVSCARPIAQRSTSAKPPREAIALDAPDPKSRLLLGVSELLYEWSPNILQTDRSIANFQQSLRGITDAQLDSGRYIGQGHLWIKRMPRLIESNQDMTIHFNLMDAKLNRINVASAISFPMNFTDMELKLIFQHPEWWPRTTFYELANQDRDGTWYFPAFHAPPHSISAGGKPYPRPPTGYMVVDNPFIR